jgi:hypothetical protein
MRGEPMTVAATMPPTLDEFPVSFAALPEPHREVMALVEAHRRRRGRGLSWGELRSHFEALASEPTEGASLRALLGARGLAPSLRLVVGDLTDYGLLALTMDGISVASAAEHASPGWNGEFQEMVQEAEQAFEDDAPPE